MVDGDDPGTARRQLHDGSDDDLVREEPLLIQIDGQQLLTMRTPGSDPELAAGFLLSEGIVERLDQISDVQFTRGDAAERRPDAITLRLDPSIRERAAGRLTRTHEIRSSCGVCGMADADSILEDLPPLLPGVPRITLEQIEQRRADFEAHQPLFGATGGCHAATVFGGDGAVWGRGEDVGRHNALDKAIATAARSGRDLAHGIAFLSGRAGFDLILKCLRVRIPVILSVSATSSLSLDVCAAAGATLVGFVRAGRAKVYCDSGRITT